MSFRVRLYVGYIAGKHGHTWAIVQEGVCKSRKVIVWDRTTKDKLLGFAGVIYHFVHLFVGHFPYKGALVRSNIILMIS